MVEPSDNLQAVFEKAIDTAKKLHHVYLTIEHLVFAMLADDGFASTIAGQEVDVQRDGAVSAITLMEIAA